MYKSIMDLRIYSLEFLVKGFSNITHHITRKGFVIVLCVDSAQNYDLSCQLSSWLYVLLLKICNLCINLLGPENMSIFFDLRKQITVRNCVYFALIELSEIIILRPRKIIHQIAPDLFKIYHMLLEIFVSRHELFVDLIQLCD